MKRILSVLLLISMLLSLVSCSSSLGSLEGETATETTEANQNEAKGDIVYPDGFAVGYATADISGDPINNPVSTDNGVANGILDKLLLTCIAIWDGEEVALVMTVDLKKMFRSVSDRSFSIIEKKFGIPAENIILTCTHSHSAPDTGTDGQGKAQWLKSYYAQVPVVVEAALRDLDLVKDAYSGKADQVGIGFVRRYKLADGTYKMNPSAGDNPVEHESEADPEMRTIRFDRKNKKDVLLVNFQTHYYGAKAKNKLSADFVDPFRKSAEKEFDCLFAYYSGASADINQVARLPEDKEVKASNADEAFMEGARKCLEAEEKIKLGDLKIEHSEYTAQCKIDSEERFNQAKEVSGGRADPATYGFASKEEADYAIYYGTSEPTMEIPFTVIAFGDVAFASAAYEMFHKNGSFIRENSPYKTTFICTLAHGVNGYVPTAEGYEHGGYETWNCRFVAGSGEKFADEIVRLLNASKN
ncbi:MAG: hypothetical protein IKU24_01740 [Clostridia bacterium]|nr:hypothetical protein [Clostridia bacterium]